MDSMMPLCAGVSSTSPGRVSTAAGAAGSYRNRPAPVYARQYAQAFVVTRASGDVLHGRAGDWLLQYGKGDHGIADAGRFARVYRAIAD